MKTYVAIPNTSASTVDSQANQRTRATTTRTTARGSAMTTHKEALKLALEALEKHGDAYLGHSDEYQFAITKVKEALAQPEQEPVARMLVKDGIGWIEWKNPIRLSDGLHDLHTTPPQRTWVGLTDEEVKKIAYNTAERKVAKDIEAKLKEKNDC